MAEGDSLATLLIQLRVQAGMSQEGLASVAGVSAQTISDIERGTTLAPRAATIDKIAMALELDAAMRERLNSCRVLPAKAGPPGNGDTVDDRPGDKATATFVASSLGQAVGYLRMRLELSAAELGRRSKLSARTIADIEAGRRKRVHPVNAVNLADALGLSADARQRFMDLASGATVAAAMRRGAAEPAHMAGRERELGKVLAMLATHRLVSLTGTGGVGKTTLAEAALANLDRPCVSMFLADIAIGEDLARAIALTGRFDEDSGAAWVSQLGPLLPPDAVLLLDNLEHLHGVPKAIGEILGSRPDVTLLTTSRIAIELAGAGELEVEPLRLAAACRVFRAAAAQTGKVGPAPVQGVVEQICLRLDRLPLAITLTASWSRLMTPQEILARLDRSADLMRVPGTRHGQEGFGADARHATIARTVGWSLALVSESAQALFRSLAAYSAPWPLDLIEAVCLTDDVLDSLNELLQARLVTTMTDAADGTSYMMLQTVRDVGRDELAADRRVTAQVLERHAAHLLERARQIGPTLVTSDRPAARAKGDQLALHMEGALRHLTDSGDSRAVSLAAAWWRYWKERGRFSSGLTLIADALRVQACQDETALRDTAEAIYGAAALGYLAGANKQATDYAADALARFQALGDAAGIGAMMSLIGMMELHFGHTRTALEWYQRGLREIDDDAAPRAYATLLANIAPVYAALDDLSSATAAAQDAAARYQVLGDRAALAAQVGNLGLWAARVGARDRAAELLQESRDLLVELQDFTNLIEAHLDLAKLHVDDGDTAAAQAELAAARRFAGRADDSWGDALADALAAQIAVLIGDMVAARSVARVAMSKGRKLGYKAAIVGAALADSSAAAWSNDARGALAAAGVGLAQADQADEAAVVSLALLVAAVLTDGAGLAMVDPDLLELERMVRSWASAPGGRPHVIARLAGRRRGLSLSSAGPADSLPPIEQLRARALALCRHDRVVG